MPVTPNGSTARARPSSLEGGYGGEKRERVLGSGSLWPASPAPSVRKEGAPRVPVPGARTTCRGRGRAGSVALVHLFGGAFVGGSGGALQTVHGEDLCVPHPAGEEALQTVVARGAFCQRGT